MPIATINPATGETLQTFDAHTAAQVDEKLQRASDAFERHRRTSLDERARKMACAGEILDGETDRLARRMPTEMGRSLAAARAEAEGAEVDAAHLGAGRRFDRVGEVRE